MIMLERTLVSLALALVTTATGLASTNPAPDCSSGHVKVEAVVGTKAALASLNESMGRQQARLDAGIRDAAARAKWSDQDRARFFHTVLRSKPNAGFDKQIDALTVELRKLLQASQRGEVKGPAAECRHVARVRELAGQLESVLDRQSAYLDLQLRNAR